MSFPTTSTFISNYTNGWEEARIHPALAWLEKATKAFDSRESWSTPWSDWHTDDYTFINPHGEVTTGGEAAFKATQENYRPFSSSIHEPVWACVWEDQSENAWYVVAEAILYGDFPETDTKKEGKRFEDREGRKWDVGLYGMFRFEFVKDVGAVHDGLKMRRLRAYCDTGPMVVEMLKRGMMQPEDLLK